MGGYAPFFNDEIPKLVVAVARGRGVAFVQCQDQMCGIRANHEHPDVQHVSRGQHHLPLPIGVLVRGVLVECHLGGEAALLGWNSQVNDTKRKNNHEVGTPNSYIHSITYHVFKLKMQRSSEGDSSKT